jgi:hypothetical protein
MITGHKWDLAQYGDVIKISAKEILGYEYKQDKPWSDKECSKFVDKEKQVKLRWSQDPSHINAENQSNVTS